VLHLVSVRRAKRGVKTVCTTVPHLGPCTSWFRPNRLHASVRSRATEDPTQDPPCLTAGSAPFVLRPYPPLSASGAPCASEPRIERGRIPRRQNSASPLGSELILSPLPKTGLQEGDETPPVDAGDCLLAFQSVLRAHVSVSSPAVGYRMTSSDFTDLADEDVAECGDAAGRDEEREMTTMMANIRTTRAAC
jgi:hypothetical protein